MTIGGADEPTHVGQDEASDRVGRRIRQLRQAYGMSQRRLADIAGMTNGAISMIEQCRVSPSVATLKKVLEAFDLSLSEFFADDFEPTTRAFYRAHEMTKISDGLLKLRQVGGKAAKRTLQVLHELYAVGGDTGAEMLSHEGEEAGIVVRGQIEVTVGAKTDVLKAGDGFYFDSRRPHRFRNLGPDECEIVSVCTPSTF